MSVTNAPAGRDAHTAIWDGNEMIVWGGRTNGVSVATNTGGRYNPSTDTWTATTVVNAPPATFFHTAVWTGTEMIVHGGFGGPHGKKYNPSTNTWTDITSSGVGRMFHTAVWTGSQMIVWGGATSFGTATINTGSRYNPLTNTWQGITLTNAPTARILHTGVWSGTELIVWGGTSDINGTNRLNSGARYNPSSNTWIAMPLTNAPGARGYHTAVWTGQKKIIFGGRENGGNVNTGALYDPSTNTYGPATLVDMYLYRKN